MRIKKFFCYTSVIFLILYVLGGIPDSMASTSNNEELTINQFVHNNSVDEYKAHVGSFLDDHPDLLRWNMEVNGRVFQILVDQDSEVIIVRGEVEDYKLKEKIENYVKARAPTNFRIIYEIDAFGTSERNRRGVNKRG